MSARAHAAAMFCRSMIAENETMITGTRVICPAGSGTFTGYADQLRQFAIVRLDSGGEWVCSILYVSVARAA